ncbi:MAG: Nucleoside diphosphate kinase [candidate division WS6 bacterium OLB20]|uniref:nucleoside-diphosphate kinase n=1 Tax=candidate division WS6 bacterium OLB20 TaxID=1617426 RepID=A0A136LYF7_9BACT|nr:MAG: Nucleoside diphosphate kinase [candidate division WS6 bacterium OLB20]
MSNLPNIEKTFFMIKPDGIKRGLVGEIFSRLERIGLKLVAARLIQATEEQARGNYPGTDEWMTAMGEKTLNNYNHDLKAVKADLGTDDPLEIGKKIYDALVNYLVDGPVLIAVWEGNHAVKVVERLMGKTDPTVADVGTIRGDFGFDTPQFAVKSGRIVFRTLVHRSDAADEAEREIEHWFGDKYTYLGDYDRADYTGSYEAFI